MRRWSAGRPVGAAARRLAAGLRLIAALAGAGLVALDVLVAGASAAGASRRALAGLAVLVVADLPRQGSVLTMNAFEPLFWMGCVYVGRPDPDGGDSRCGSAFGALLGLGLKNKHSTVFFGVAVAAACSSRRCAANSRSRGRGSARAWRSPSSCPTWSGRSATTSRRSRTCATSPRSGKNVDPGPVGLPRSSRSSSSIPSCCPLWAAGLPMAPRERGGPFPMLGWTASSSSPCSSASTARTTTSPDLPCSSPPASRHRRGRRAAASRRAGSGRQAARARRHLAGRRAHHASRPASSTPGLHRVPGGARFRPSQDRGRPRRTAPAASGATSSAGRGAAADVAAVFRGATARRPRPGVLSSPTTTARPGRSTASARRSGCRRVISGHQTHFFWGPKDCTRRGAASSHQDDRESLERVVHLESRRPGMHVHPWGMAAENGAIWVCRGLKLPNNSWRRGRG